MPSQKAHSGEGTACDEVCDDLQQVFDTANAQLAPRLDEREDMDVELEPGLQGSNATLYDLPESDDESDIEAIGGNERLRNANPDPGATPTGGQ